MCRSPRPPPQAAVKGAAKSPGGAAEDDGVAGEGASGPSGTSTATVKREALLKFSVSAHTSRLWLYDADGASMGTNITMEDARSRNSAALPETLRERGHLDEIQRFVRDFSKLRAIEQKALTNVVLSKASAAVAHQHQKANARVAITGKVGGKKSTIRFTPKEAFDSAANVSTSRHSAGVAADGGGAGTAPASRWPSEMTPESRSSETVVQSSRAARKAVMLQIKTRANNGSSNAGSAGKSRDKTPTGGAGAGSGSASASGAASGAAPGAGAGATDDTTLKVAETTKAPKKKKAKVAGSAAAGAAARGCQYCKQPVPSLPWSVSPSESKQSATLFCSHECWEQYSVQIGRDVRRRLLELEKGVCQLCKLDTKALYTTLKSLQNEDDRREALMQTKFRRFDPKRFQKLLSKPTSGQLWQADHIIPVCEGGGECDLNNYRTLCTVCHQEQTNKLSTGKRDRKKVTAAKGSSDIRGFFSPK